MVPAVELGLARRRVNLPEGGLTAATETALITVDPSGYDRTKLPPYEATMIHVPHVLDNGYRIVIRVLNREVECSGELNTHLPQYTVVLIGGGASDAKANAGLVARLEAAIVAQSRTDKIPVKVKNILALSQAQGAPRTRKILDTDDWSISTGILRKTLEDPAVPKAHGGIMLVGFSAGAAQTVELAAKLGDRCRGVVVVDPAGMGNHPDMFWRLGLNATADVYRHFCLQGEPPWQAFKHTLEEAKLSMTTPDGSPKHFFQILQALFATPPVQENVATAYGFRKRLTPGEVINFPLLSTDSTHSACYIVRAPVLGIPVEFANVVNQLRDRNITGRMLACMWGWEATKDPKYKTRLYKEIKRHYPHWMDDGVKQCMIEYLDREFIDDLYKGIFADLFPRAQAVQVAVDRGGLHSGVLRKDETWKAVVGWIAEIT